MENSAKPDSLDPGTLHSILQQLSAAEPVKTWWLAYSGGIDSQVLLHLLAPLSLNLHAVYIDHQLQPESTAWREHCRKSCEALDVPFRAIAVDVHPKAGDGPEAAARKARYGALAELVGPGDCLLTAQHRDDQAETFLLQLFRGAGAPGLASMPVCTDFSRGRHLRPLLDYSRQDIEDYARSRGLSWVEDPSNESAEYDRNFLRHQVLPGLRQRWPALSRTLGAAATQQAENHRLLEQLAQLDMRRLDDPADGLSIQGLQGMDTARLKNLLRFWIKQQGHPLPPRRVLQQILQQMFSPRADAVPKVSWAASELHRYRDRLYLSRALHHDASQKLAWDGRQPLELSALGQRLSLSVTPSAGLRADILERGELWVGFRQGGETIRPQGRQGHHHLKQLFQEAGGPPWRRPCIPLIYQGQQLVAVAGYWIADEYACAPGDSGLTPQLSEID